MVLMLCCCSNSIRRLILFLSFLVISSLFSNLMIYNLAAVYYEQLLPSHLAISSYKYFFKLFIESLLFGAPGLGILIAHYPSNIFLKLYGSKKIILFSLIVSGLLTLVFPFIVVEYGQFSIIFIRLLLGMCFAPVFSFIGTNTANWAKISEQHFFLTFCFFAFQSALFISWRLSFFLFDLTTNKFNLVFEIHAAISGILAIIWLIFYQDTPQKHFLINGDELNKIMTGRNLNNNFTEKEISTKLIKSVSAWVIWISSFGYFFAFITMANFIPFYVFKVLKYRLESSILFPFILLFVFHLFAHQILQLKNSSTFKVRILNTIAFTFSAFAFLGLATTPPNYFFLQRIILYLCLAPLGFSTGGFIESAVVYGRYYTQFIISKIQLSFGLAMFISPIVVFFLTVENNMRYWRLVFCSVAIILFVSAAIFALFARGKSSSWASSSWDPNVTYKMESFIPISNSDECGLIEVRKVSQ